PQMLTFMLSVIFLTMFFYFTDPSPSEINTLSLHDALPISVLGGAQEIWMRASKQRTAFDSSATTMSAKSEGALRENIRSITNLGDRKSTRLNSSHVAISYAVFCLKKKKKNQITIIAFSQNP